MRAHDKDGPDHSSIHAVEVLAPSTPDTELNLLKFRHVPCEGCREAIFIPIWIVREV